MQFKDKGYNPKQSSGSLQAWKLQVGRSLSYSDKVDFGVLEERLHNVLPLLHKFENIQAQIEQLSADTEDTDPIADFESSYYTTVSHARDILKKKQNSN